MGLSIKDNINHGGLRYIMIGKEVCTGERLRGDRSHRACETTARDVGGGRLRGGAQCRKG